MEPGLFFCLRREPVDDIELFPVASIMKRKSAVIIVSEEVIAPSICISVVKGRQIFDFSGHGVTGFDLTRKDKAPGANGRPEHILDISVT